MLAATSRFAGTLMLAFLSSCAGGLVAEDSDPLSSSGSNGGRKPPPGPRDASTASLSDAQSPESDAAAADAGSPQMDSGPPQTDSGSPPQDTAPPPPPPPPPPLPSYCNVHADQKLYCTNRQAPMYAAPNDSSGVVDTLRTTNSWFACWGTGQLHAGNNTTWYRTVGDDYGATGWVAAVYLDTPDTFDANPSAYGFPACN